MSKAVVGVRPSECPEAAHVNWVPHARCSECRRRLLLAEPLGDGEVALCRGCAALGVFRRCAWAWVNSEHAELSRRLALPRDGTRLPAFAALVAAINRRYSQN